MDVHNISQNIIISLDSLFSLIIFVYVSVTFLYVFYAFCWREQMPDTRREKGHYVIVEDQEPELVI